MSSDSASDKENLDSKAGDGGNAGESEREKARFLAERRFAWRNSPEFRKSRKIYWSILVTGMIINIATVEAGAIKARMGFWEIGLNWDIQWPYYFIGLVTFIFTFGVAVTVRSSYRNEFDDRVLVQNQADLAGAESRLAAHGDLELADLWAVTQQRLDYYHNIATGQAKQSFRNAQMAMLAGFLILLAGVTLSLTANSATASIVSGSLSGIGAVLASYIGKTFIRSQESTAEHLRSYFNQPLEFSRFLAAERLLNIIDGNARAAAAEQIIKGIVNEGRPAKF